MTPAHGSAGKVLHSSTSIDVEEWRSGTDLLSLVASVTDLRRAASTNGGEFVGPCPFCGGGRDRFHVWPNRERPGWWCRVCHRQGDAIEFLRQYYGLSFVEACARLGIDPPDPGERPASLHRPSALDNVQGRLGNEAPSSAWQERARWFISLAQDHLWGKLGEAGLRYLRETRGLRDETIRRWRLGWSHFETRDEPEQWGLTGERIWRPLGVVIPCEAQGSIWSVKIRRPDPGNGPKYTHIRGGRAALFGADSIAVQHTAVLTEGEFDAMLLHQEAGDLVDVVATGSAVRSLPTRWLWTLRNARRILVAYDADEPGQTAAAALVAQSRRMQVVRPVGATDLSEMRSRGGDLRSWAHYQLARHSERGFVAQLDETKTDETSPSALYACAAPVSEACPDCGWPSCICSSNGHEPGAGLPRCDSCGLPLVELGDGTLRPCGCGGRP